MNKCGDLKCKVFKPVAETDRWTLTKRTRSAAAQFNTWSKETSCQISDVHSLLTSSDELIIVVYYQEEEGDDQ